MLGTSPDVATTVALMLARKGFSERLALAIAYLERHWDELPYPVRFRRSLNEELAALHGPLEEILSGVESVATSTKSWKVG